MIRLLVLSAVFVCVLGCNKPNSAISNVSSADPRREHGDARPIEVKPSTEVIEDQARQKLANAQSLVLQWEAEERARFGNVSADNGSLELLHIDQFSPVVPWFIQNRSFQYGRASVQFDLRRAAYFAGVLQGLSTLYVGDLSASDGSTPSDAAGLRHPQGAHIDGFSADVAYPGIVEGSGVDYRQTTWILYSLFESTGVATIITAFREEILTIARELFNNNLIEEQALARFEIDVWQDSTLNHDSHFHINTTTRDGLLSSPSNSYYRCFTVFRGSYGTVWSRTSC